MRFEKVRAVLEQCAAERRYQLVVDAALPAHLIAHIIEVRLLEDLEVALVEVKELPEAAVETDVLLVLAAVHLYLYHQPLVIILHRLPEVLGGFLIRIKLLFCQRSGTRTLVVGIGAAVGID